MSRLPEDIISVLSQLAPIFSARVWPQAQTLLIGALLAPGKRTVSAVLEVMGLAAQPQFQTYHRLLNRCVWSPMAGSQRLLALLVATFAPTGWIVLGLDDTIERRRGAHIRAQGIYRDPVRSSRSHVVKASGLRWLSLMLLTPIGWADRVWALPFMSVLCPSQRYYTQQDRPAVSLLQRAQSMLHVVARWLPGRRIVVVADSSFAALAFLDAVASYGTVLTRLRLDAALYAPAPLQRGPFTLPPTPSGRPGYAVANPNDPSWVWPPPAHRGGLFPNRRLVSHRLAARADSMAAHPRSAPHLCPPSVAIDSSAPVAPADADVFYAALGGRNYL